ncbi:uncharacterized protein LOC108022054 [Drosophila biarmipes]|uniref:uncharacterized protein LOC108022054 n=1 Tax=Drosophila biarmipes TaxID=125945 RepID=UPI0007E831A8|nr:uncharacterized protein LOC108022054 [Drosophila biarmipes]
MAPIILHRGNTEFIFGSLEADCDHDYVEYFHKVPNTTFLHTFRVTKLISSFNIDVVVKVVKTQRVFYKSENIRGCDLLKNPLLFKNFGKSYKHLVVNGSFFKCPIEPKVYYLKNEPSMSTFPTVHPTGHFQLTMRLKIPNSPHPFAMKTLWIYNIVRIK